MPAASASRVLVRVGVPALLHSARSGTAHRRGGRLRAGEGSVSRSERSAGSARACSRHCRRSRLRSADTAARVTVRATTLTTPGDALRAEARECHDRLHAGRRRLPHAGASSSRTPAAGWPGPSARTTGASAPSPRSRPTPPWREAIAVSEPVTMAVSDAQFEHCRSVLSPSVRVVEISTRRRLDARHRARPSWSTTAGGRRGVDWRFNAWGGLEGGLYFPWDRDERVAQKVLEIERADRYRAPIVLEGGSIHVDGEGTVLTTEECLLNRNRNPGLSREQIERCSARLPRRREGDLARPRRLRRRDRRARRQPRLLRAPRRRAAHLARGARPTRSTRSQRTHWQRLEAPPTRADAASR